MCYISRATYLSYVQFDSKRILMYLKQIFNKHVQKDRITKEKTSCATSVDCISTAIVECSSFTIIILARIVMKGLLLVTGISTV